MENKQIEAAGAVPPLHHGNCPSCGTSLDGGGIWQHFYDEFTSGRGYWLNEAGAYTSVKRMLSPAEAEVAADNVAEHYGANRTKGRWGRAIGLVENDRCNTFRCPDCNEEWNVFAEGIAHG